MALVREGVRPPQGLRKARQLIEVRGHPGRARAVRPLANMYPPPASHEDAAVVWGTGARRLLSRVGKTPGICVASTRLAMGAGAIPTVYTHCVTAAVCLARGEFASTGVCKGEGQRTLWATECAGYAISARARERVAPNPKRTASKACHSCAHSKRRHRESMNENPRGFATAGRPRLHREAVQPCSQCIARPTLQP